MTEDEFALVVYRALVKEFKGRTLDLMVARRALSTLAFEFNMAHLELQHEAAVNRRKGPMQKLPVPKGRAKRRVGR